MKDEDIAAYASSLEPMRHPYGGPAYRCAAYLNDGLFLPCVVIASGTSAVDLAVRRFDETRGSWLQQLRAGRKAVDYRAVVEAFVVSGNRVNGYDVGRLERSRFAIPLPRLAEVHGETSMNWTQFVGIMRDGKRFSFGTTFLSEFFHMPEGYTGDDVVGIVPHERVEGEVYRERPFFTCYASHLE